MFCKMCFDANRIGFDQHCIRNGAGEVVCPYLLSISCLACGEKGHTTKYCKNTNKASNKASKKVGEKKEFIMDSDGFQMVGKNKGGRSAVVSLVEEEDWSLGFELSDIVWGVGMLGKQSWADACGE